MLAIRKSDHDRILDHCRKALPNEACGILGGKDGRVGSVHCMTNVRPGPASYEMDPEEQFRVLRLIREAGQDLVGIFHSHPQSPAYPSGTDVECAYWPGTLFPNYPGAVYVIVSMMQESGPVVRAFSIEENAVSEVPLDIDDGSSTSGDRGRNERCR